MAAEIAAAILKEEPQPFPELRFGQSGALHAIASACLEKRPEDRLNSAHDVAVILDAVDSATATPLPQRHSFIAKRWPHILAIFVATTAALFFVFPPEGLFERSVEDPAEADPPRIVVLPFENLGPPEDEYFADGMTEEIISRLAAASGLLVISRTSAMFYKDRRLPVGQIGEELDAQYVLEGTVRWERAGEGFGRVRITPQLIKVADDTHLWSNRYDRAIESVFEVQSDIAEQIVGQLDLTLSGAERRAIDARPTNFPEAYQAYLRGLQYYPGSEDFEEIRLGVAMFERAVELDPEFVLAWALLAEMHSLLYHYYVDRTPERQAAAKQAVDRALSLDPALPEGHRSMGYYHYFCHLDYEKALASFARVLATRPNDTYAMAGQGYVMRRQGRWTESTDLLERAFALDPKNSELPFNLTFSYLFPRNHERAEKYADLAISLAPDKVDGYVAKWDVFTGQGRYREARQVLEDAPVQARWLGFWQEIAERRFEAALARVHDTPVAVYEAQWGKGNGALVRAQQECDGYFYLGDHEGIQEACERALTLAEQRVLEDPENPVAHGRLGRLYAMFGRKNDAIREGRRAVELLPVSKEAFRGPNLVRRLAVIYILVGELDAAIDQIEYLLSIPSRVTVGGLRVHPHWDPLRDHPRFHTLLEKNDTN